jgi:type II secretory pathway component PulF
VRSTLPPTAFAIILALVGVLAARQRSTTARLRIDAAILRAPFVGRLFGRIETGRFLSVLGLLLGNGVTVLRAFELARGTLTNAALVAATGAGEGAVRRGKRLRAALDQALVLTPEETLLLQVGEESRSLAESCHGLGETIENDNAALLQRAVKLIEPTVILVMGLVVGVIVAGLLLGVYSLSDI